MHDQNDPLALTDPREIRKRLMEVRYGRHYARMSGGYGNGQWPDRCSGLVSAVLNGAEHMGYSGEDTMTMLAYHALLAYEKATDALLEFHNISLRPVLVDAPTEPPRT